MYKALAIVLQKIGCTQLVIGLRNLCTYMWLSACVCLALHIWTDKHTKYMKLPLMMSYKSLSLSLSLTTHTHTHTHTWCMKLSFPCIIHGILYICLNAQKVHEVSYNALCTMPCISRICPSLNTCVVLCMCRVKINGKSFSM